jgi:hypothetical protein
MFEVLEDGQKHQIVKIDDIGFLNFPLDLNFNLCDYPLQFCVADVVGLLVVGDYVVESDVGVLLSEDQINRRQYYLEEMSLGQSLRSMNE